MTSEVSVLHVQPFAQRQAAPNVWQALAGETDPSIGPAKAALWGELTALEGRARELLAKVAAQRLEDARTEHETLAVQCRKLRDELIGLQADKGSAEAGWTSAKKATGTARQNLAEFENSRPAPSAYPLPAEIDSWIRKRDRLRAALASCVENEHGAFGQYAYLNGRIAEKQKAFDGLAAREKELRSVLPVA